MLILLSEEQISEQVSDCDFVGFLLVKATVLVEVVEC